MLSIGAQFVRLITILRAAIGIQVARQLRPPQPVWLGARCFVPLLPPGKRPALPESVWTLLWLRLQRLADRFAALHDQWRRGCVPAPRPKRPSRPAAPGAPRLPRAFAWVNHRILEAAPPAGMLQSLLLNEPETRRFVAEVPRAGRLLRPLCQALGVKQPEWLKLPPRPRTPRPRKPRPERPWRLTDPRLGLPPNVIAAARAAKKQDGG